MNFCYDVENQRIVSPFYLSPVESSSFTCMKPILRLTLTILYCIVRTFKSFQLTHFMKFVKTFDHFEKSPDFSEGRT